MDKFTGRVGQLEAKSEDSIELAKQTSILAQLEKKRE